MLRPVLAAAATKRGRVAAFEGCRWNRLVLLVWLLRAHSSIAFVEVATATVAQHEPTQLPPAACPADGESSCRADDDVSLLHTRPVQLTQHDNLRPSDLRRNRDDTMEPNIAPSWTLSPRPSALAAEGKTHEVLPAARTRPPYLTQATEATANVVDSIGVTNVATLFQNASRGTLLALTNATSFNSLGDAVIKGSSAWMLLSPTLAANASSAGGIAIVVTILLLIGVCAICILIEEPEESDVPVLTSKPARGIVRNHDTASSVRLRDSPPAGMGVENSRDSLKPSATPLNAHDGKAQSPPSVSSTPKSSVRQPQQAILAAKESLRPSDLQAPPSLMPPRGSTGQQMPPALCPALVLYDCVTRLKFPAAKIDETRQSSLGIGVEFDIHGPLRDSLFRASICEVPGGRALGVSIPRQSAHPWAVVRPLQQESASLLQGMLPTHVTPKFKPLELTGPDSLVYGVIVSQDAGAQNYVIHRSMAAFNINYSSVTGKIVASASNGQVLGQMETKEGSDTMELVVQSGFDPLLVLSTVLAVLTLVLTPYRPST